MNHTIPNSRRIFEMVMAVFTGIAKILVVDVLHARPYFIITTISFWFLYIGYRLVQDKSLKAYWGLSNKGMKETTKTLIPFAIVGSILILLFGIIFHPNNFNWHLVVVMALYPVWGLVQQFLTMNLIAGNWQDYSSASKNKTFIIVFTASVFGLIHYPSFELIGATFLMGLLYSWVFLKYRNIVPLGVFHGVMGAMFYYLVLGKDPLNELLRMF